MCLERGPRLRETKKQVFILGNDLYGGLYRLRLFIRFKSGWADFGDYGGNKIVEKKKRYLPF